MERAQRLSSLAVFSDLPAQDLLRLAELADWQRVAREELLFRAGEAGTHLLVVVTGRFEVFIGQEGARISLGQVGPGELLGEASLFRRSVLRSADVRALEDGELIRVDAALLGRLLDEGSGVPRAIETAVLSTLSRRIQSSGDLVGELLKSEGSQGGLFTRLAALVGR